MSEQAHTATAHRDYTGAKLGMWLFLFTEVLLFGGLFLVYAVYRSMYTDGFHRAAAELNVALGTVNTIILLTSSLTMALAISAIQRGKRTPAMRYQWATLALGLLFLVNKYFEWSAKFQHGIYPGSPDLLARDHGQVLFYGLYYAMTGLHGLHVIAGLVLIAIMLWYTAVGQVNLNDYVKIENAGLYWHLVDLIWIYLFPLFYLIA